MTYRGRVEPVTIVQTTRLVRPYIDGTADLPHVPPPPVDVRPDCQESWNEGNRLRTQHLFDPTIGCCIACGSTEGPHCGWWRAGYNMMRAALVNPRSMPIIDP